MFLMQKVAFNRNALFLALYFLAVAAFAIQTQAAVAVDNSTVNGAFSNTGLSTLSIPHDVGGGVNRALYVGVSTSTTVLPIGIPANRVTSVTFESQTAAGTQIPLERVGTQVSPDTRNAVEIFRLINPPTGAGNVIVNFSIGGTIPAPFVNYAVGGVVSFTGVNQLTPNRMFFSSGGTSAAPTVIVADSAAGDLVLDTLAVSPMAGFAVPGAGQTEQWTGRLAFGSVFDVGAGSTKAAVSSVTTMSWTLTNSDSWALGAAAIQPALAATAATVTIAGRVTTASGRGISRARVSMIDSNGATRTALTNLFGNYRFRDVPAGEIYTFQVSAKRYKFDARLFNVNEESGGLNFIAAP